MSEPQEFSVQTAQAAAERDELGEWVSRFLRSPGSDNAALAEILSERLSWWVGPVRLPLKRLHRLAGPPDEPVLCPVDEEFWDDRVDDMAERIEEEGWEPTPVIVSYRDGDLVLEDGNHRSESLRRAGEPETWAVVGFERREDRDRFAGAVAS